jgi:hypothetical protein
MKLANVGKSIAAQDIKAGAKRLTSEKKLLITKCTPKKASPNNAYVAAKWCI